MDLRTIRAIAKDVCEKFVAVLGGSPLELVMWMGGWRRGDYVRVSRNSGASRVFGNPQQSVLIIGSDQEVSVYRHR